MPLVRASVPRTLLLVLSLVETSLAAPRELATLDSFGVAVDAVAAQCPRGLRPSGASAPLSCVPESADYANFADLRCAPGYALATALPVASPLCSAADSPPGAPVPPLQCRANFIWVADAAKALGGSCVFYGAGVPTPSATRRAASTPSFTSARSSQFPYPLGRWVC
jgi:hypothetical protein